MNFDMIYSESTNTNATIIVLSYSAEQGSNDELKLMRFQIKVGKAMGTQLTSPKVSNQPGATLSSPGIINRCSDNSDRKKSIFCIQGSWQGRVADSRHVSHWEQLLLLLRNPSTQPEHRRPLSYQPVQSVAHNWQVATNSVITVHRSAAPQRSSISKARDRHGRTANTSPTPRLLPPPFSNEQRLLSAIKAVMARIKRC